MSAALADDFRQCLREEVEALADEALPGDASLLLPPVQVACNCLRLALVRCFTEFRESRSRANTTATISKFAPILEQQAVILSTVLPAVFSRHKLKLFHLYNCGSALLPPPLPSDADMQTAIKRALLPPLSRDALRQAALLMQRCVINMRIISSPAAALRYAH